MLLYNDFESVKAHGIFDTLHKENSTSLCAFKVGEKIIYKVGVPREFCTLSAEFIIYSDSDMSICGIAANFDEETDNFAYDNFYVEIDTKKLGEGLFYHTFAFDTFYGKLYIDKDGGFTKNFDLVSKRQLLIYSLDFQTPDVFKGKMIYQIFPDRFKKSCRKFLPTRGFVDNCENFIPQYPKVPGGEVANNKFFGGTLYGIAEELDYIKGLGVDIIYLCPIFESASNHRYDTGDYFKIDGLLGGEQGFKYLVSEIKKRGMKLILDGVFNHTGADSIYFNKFSNYESVGAYESVDSEYYDWYTFKEYPDDYRCWWGVKILPAVKSYEPSFREFICGENGVIRHYLKMGADGWRLDVADELSDEFLFDLRNAAKDEAPDSLILGEVWEDASNKVAYGKRRKYFLGKQLDSVMNYPLRQGIIDFVLTKDNTVLLKEAEIIYSHYPPECAAVLMNILGTHDTERIISILANVGIEEMTNDELSIYRLPENVKNAAARRIEFAWELLCGFPGCPCIYYGDEIGMEGGRDPFNRMPFEFDMSENTLVECYRKIGEIRKGSLALRLGNIEFKETFDKRQIIFSRVFEDEKIVVCANLSDSYMNAEFESDVIPLIGNGDKNGRVLPNCVEYYKFK